MTSVFSLTDQLSDTTSDAGWYQNLNVGEILGGEEGDWRMRRFWVAIRSNDVQQLVNLLRSGVDPNVPNYEGHGELALTEATYRGYSSMVEILLEAGASVNARNIQGETALHVAAHPHRFDTRIFLLYLDNPSSNFNIQDHKGFAPLHVLVRNIVQRKNGSTTSSDIDEMLVILKLLVQKSNVNKCSHTGDTPLHIAVSGSHENVDALKILIVGGADFNLPNERHETPLLTAINCGHSALATTLINLGADLTVRDDNMQTAMHRAAQTNLPSVVRHLVAQNCDVNCVDKMGDTALHLAAGRGYIHVVRALLQDPNIRILKENQQKHTPLHCALASGFLNVAQILFSALSIPFHSEVKKVTFQTIDEYLAKRYPLQELPPAQSTQELSVDIQDDSPGDHAPTFTDYDTELSLSPLLEEEIKFSYNEEEAGDYVEDEEEESEPIPKPPPIVIKMENCKNVSFTDFDAKKDEDKQTGEILRDEFINNGNENNIASNTSEHPKFNVEPGIHNKVIINGIAIERIKLYEDENLLTSKRVESNFVDNPSWSNTDILDSLVKLNSSSSNNIVESLKFTPEAPINDFGDPNSRQISDDINEICSRFYGMKQLLQERNQTNNSSFSQEFNSLRFFRCPTDIMVNNFPKELSKTPSAVNDHKSRVAFNIPNKVSKESDLT